MGEGMGVGLAVGGKCEQALGVFAIPSFLRRQEFARSSASVCAAPPPHVQRQMSHACCVGSCLRRNDGEGRRSGERERVAGRARCG